MKILYFLLLMAGTSQARTAFEKMTDVDYQGETYYTIRNLSLYECQGWCREEVECQAASFSFVANDLGKQETVCLLQNGTQANNPTSKPIPARNQYYMVKMSIRSDKVCKRPWNFERVPNSIIQGHDRALIFTSTKEACLAACLNERNFVCRSAEYNYVTLQCRLSDYDRRTLEDSRQSINLVEAQGVDYFENLCLDHTTACDKERSYQPPANYGIPAQKVAAHVKINFYVDKELMANSVAACSRACTVEAEFLCRSFLYLGPPTGSDYNCKLYHMDHWSLPDGLSTFLSSKVPTTITDGSRIGNYYENRCEPLSGNKQPKQFNLAREDEDDSMLCKTVVTRDRRYITQITCYEKGNEQSQSTERLPTYGKQSNGGALASLFNFPSRSSSLTRTRNQLRQQLLTGQLSIDNGGQIDTDLGINSGINGNDGSTDNSAGSGSASTVNNPTTTANGGSSSSASAVVGGAGSSNNGGGATPGAGIPGFGSDAIEFGNNNNNNELAVGGGLDPDINCDPIGTCYDVSVHCKDTRIVVNVNTNKPFSGRIYALGRSETCNVDVINSDSFRLDLTMSGQDCNTQSVAGVYTNTVVVQRHSVVMTKADKIYKVRCTYDTTSRNITFGMMPIRDPDMISITSAPEAPAPKIRILDTRNQEVETVRIGDRLTFRIEIPDKTPYGIFARSCVAMAKDARSTFPIIDDDGCPVDPSIFPRFTPEGNALISVYEAFRFTESYGVIFQCNVKYCLGPCQPVSCTFGRDKFESWGKRRKRREVSLPANVIDRDSAADTQMRLSHEIVVLDFGDEQTNPFDFDQPTAWHNGSQSRVTPLDWNEHVSVDEEPLDDCPERTAVMGLAVACALLIVLYLCTVFCLCIRPASELSKNKAAAVVLPPEHIPGRSNTTNLGLMARDYVR